MASDLAIIKAHRPLVFNYDMLLPVFFISFYFLFCFILCVSFSVTFVHFIKLCQLLYRLHLPSQFVISLAMVLVVPNKANESVDRCLSFIVFIYRSDLNIVYFATTNLS